MASNTPGRRYISDFSDRVSGYRNETEAYTQQSTQLHLHSFTEDERNTQKECKWARSGMQER